MAKRAAKKAKKNSLVGNINRRKKAGKSRSKANSTIDDAAYEQMQAGWPKSKEKKAKKKAAKKSAGKKATRKKSRGKKTNKKSG